MIWAIIIRAFSSFFPNAYRNPLIQFIYRITDPLLRPFRRFTLRMSGSMGIDFSPIIAVLILGFLQNLLHQCFLRMMLY
ncbi:MAG: YggT family protein [Peptococcaceae bacterium]|nr:YggT family protein [Peptococcaceae bacterium]